MRAAGAGPGAIWVPLPADGAPETATSRSTLKRLVADGAVESRLTNGRREIRLSSLPPEYQEAFLQRSVADSISGQLAQARLEGSAEFRDRLGRLSPAEQASFRAEIARRVLLLQEFEALPDKRARIAGKAVPSEDLLSITERWATMDPVILQRFPSWGERCSWRSLYRALQRVRVLGPVGLMPAFREAATDDGRLRPLSNEAKALLLEMRLRTYRNATVASIYRKSRGEFETAGLPLPSETRIRLFFKKEIPRGVEIWERRGPRTFDGIIATPILRSYDDIDVGEWISGDHHEFDFPIINHERHQKLERPWLTMWLDIKSRSPMGWTISFAPSSQTILDAFVHAVRPKANPVFANLCGTPKFAYVDNGKDYRARFFEGKKPSPAASGISLYSKLAGDPDPGLFAQLGIEARHAKPYNAKAKVVERFFGTVAKDFSRNQPTWSGARPDQKTERLKELIAQHEAWREKKQGAPAKSPFMTLDELKVAFAAWVVEYMKRNHDGLRERGTRREMAPADVAELRRSAPILQDDLVLARALLEQHTPTVQKGIVTIDTVRYFHEDLWRHWCGRKVACHRDPNDVSTLWVFTLEDRTNGIRNGGFICTAKAVEEQKYSGVSEKQLEAAAKAQAEQRKRAAAWHDDQQKLLAGETALEEAKRSVAPNTPEPSSPASSVAAPAGAVTQLVPDLEKIARAIAGAQAAAAAAAATPTSGPEPTDAASLRARFATVFGERPEMPEFGTESDLAYAHSLQAEWDEEFERFCARHTDGGGAPSTATQGGPA